MKTKKLLMAASMLLGSMGATAQDAVHGVDGFYNYTPTQMKNSGQWVPGWNGKKLSGYYPEVRYTDDMKYAIFNLGVNSNSDDECGQRGFRSELVFQEVSTGDGCMTITSAYPVIAFKFSVPVNNENAVHADGSTWGFGYFEPEFSWYCPGSEDGTNPGQTNGNKNKLQLSGLDNNGRFRMVHYDPAKRDMYGRDSVYLNNNVEGGDSKYRIVGTDTIWHIMRLAPNADNPELADIVVGMNLASMKDADGVMCLDTTNIKMKNINFSFLGVNATYLDKSKDELPLVYFKWLKTFPSMDAFEKSLNEENGWGDGPEIDPNKAVLNSELYALRQVMNNYKFSDKLDILQAAYNAAVDVYNNTASTTDDYAAQVEAIASAKTVFLASIVYDNSESKMSTFYSLSGMALGLTSQDVTVGAYTGKALTLVSPENAANFLLTKSGEVAGQTCYNVQTSSYTMVQAADGQLLFVPATQLSSASAKANLVLSNRKTTDDPGYDFKVGTYYYYYSEEDGEFTTTQEFPTVEEADELMAFLFFPQPAQPYDPTDHNETTHPMTSGEGSWNEFNGNVDVVINPAYETSFAKYDWDAAVKATAMERAKQSQFEGWRTNGWRLGTGIEAVTLAKGEKTMKLTWKSEYDNIHNDSVSTSLATTDWTQPQILTIMREHGDYTSALNKAPANNQACDSLWAINMNAGINRYFAMKWKGTDEDITFNGLTFFVRKGIEEPGVGMGTLLEKRGDVYIWDLLDCGIPYGDRKACAQYMSWNNINAPEDAVYVDWMRFYSSIDEIPAETLDVSGTDGISEVSSSDSSAVTFYDLNGRKISNSRPTAKGIYLMTSGKTTYKVVVK